MNMIQKANINIGLYTLLLVLTSFPFLSLGDHGVSILFVCFLLLSDIKTTFRKYTNIIYLLGIVYIICIIQSFLYFLFCDLEFRYFSRGISTALDLILFVLLSVKVVDMYGKQALLYTVYGYMLSYVLLIFYAISIYGFWDIYNSVFSLFSQGLSSGEGYKSDVVLEKAHAFLLISPFISFVYLSSLLKKWDNKKLIIGVSLFIMSLLAFKRIAIGAVFVVAVFSLLQFTFNKITIFISAIIIIAICLGFVYSIDSNLIYHYAYIYDVNLMGRDNIWSLFNPFYEFDISYMGQGWDFVTKYLQENNTRLLGISIGGLHSDVLKIYIDFGFVGFIVYFGILLIYIPITLLSQKEEQAAFYWWLSQLYLLIIYLTDNAMIYAPCQLLVIILTLCNLRKNR